MCWEKWTDEFAETETRVVETAREDDLERLDVRREPTEATEDLPERDREFAHV